jgi:DNA-binding MarR family transcriptional regulator
MNGLPVAAQDLALDEYRELAEFRHQIRRFQSVTEQNAQNLQIEPDAYLLLLAVQGLPEGVRPTVAGLAGRLCLKKDVVSAMIDAAVARNDLTRSSADGVTAEDWVKLTRSGRDVLRRMAAANREELEHTGPELVRALQAVLKQRRRHRAISEQARGAGSAGRS